MDSHQTAVQQALVQQVSSYIAQYTPNPRIISYKPNASGDVMGKFESQGRVFSFRLSNKGLVYKPVVQRKDNESDESYALRFDTGSDILLEQLDRTDASKAYKPKPTVSIPANKKQRGTKQNPNCSAISYHCGVCISLGKNCVKNATTAALKERLQKINSLSMMAARGEALPQVKTGVIGARVDPKSLKRKVNDFVQKQSGGTKSKNAKTKVVATPDKKTSIAKPSDDIPSQLKVIDSQKAALVAKNQAIFGNKYEHQITKADKKASAKLDDQIDALDNKKSEILKTETARLSKTIESFPVADGSSIKIGSTVAVMRGGDLSRATITEINNREGGSIYGIVNANHSNRGTSSEYKKGETDEGLLFRLGDGKARVVPSDFNPSGTPTTRDRQAALRAAAEPNKTTTLSTPLPLTAQSLKKMERGESVSDFDTYSVRKEGDKFRITDPSRFEDKGKLVDKAGLAAHMKELESKPSAVKKSSSMNPVIPINNNPDTMLRALRDGRLIGDAKQGYEIQERNGSYLMTTMPNKVGDYSGVLSRKELVDFVKGGGDASRFNKEQSKEQPKPESNYVPLSTTKGMSSDRIKGNRNANQIAIDRTKKDVSNATTQINKLDQNIKKIKAGSGVMSEADLKRVAKLEANKADWVKQRDGHRTQLDKLTKPDTTQPATDDKVKGLKILESIEGVLSSGKKDDLPHGLTREKGFIVAPEEVRAAFQSADQKDASGAFSRNVKMKDGSEWIYDAVKARSVDDAITKIKEANHYGTTNKPEDHLIVKDGSGYNIAMRYRESLANARLEREVRPADKPTVQVTGETVAPPTKKADIKTLQELVSARAISDKPLEINEKAMPQNLGDYLQSVGLLEKKDGKTFLTKAGKPDDESQIFSDFPSFKDSHKSGLAQRSERESEAKRTEEFKAQQDKSYRDNRVNMAKQHGERYKNVVESVNELAKKGSDLAVNTYTHSFPVSSFPLGVDKDGGGVHQIVNGKKQALTHNQVLNLEEQSKRIEVKPTVQGTGETEAERRQFLLNTNAKETPKFVEPKREIELADVKTPQDHVKYATQELAIAKASKDPERINKWIDELQRAKKRTMSQAKMTANTYQPDLFFVNKGNPNQKSIFDSANFDADYDDSVERNILTNIGLMVSRAISGNQTSPNSVQLRKVKYDGGNVSGIFTQYGSQYDFEISSKGIVISPLHVRQDRIAGVPYAKTKNIGTNRKCGRGYKCKGTCISKNNKCRVNWATKEGLEQYKSMQSELNDLVNPRFIEIRGRQVAQQRSPEGDAKALALTKRLSEAREARKEFSSDYKNKQAKFQKFFNDRVSAEVERRLKESGFNPDDVEGSLAEIDPKTLAVDPKRFQYKIIGEHTASGSVGSLEGVETWNKHLAGILQVWKDPADGQTYVVNGHNRLHKANTLGAKKVAVRYLDVDNAIEARTIGAMTNIAEGHGTALDAAKFFRDTNWTKQDLVNKGITLKEKVASDGLAIASLEPNLFRQVIDGELPMERATIIGGSGLDHAKQKSLVELLDKRKNVTNAVLSELVDTVKYAGQKQEQQFDLFGNSTETVDLAVHRAAVQAFVKQKLASEKKLFGTVSKSKSAKDLERGGNQIDVDQSSKIAEEAATALKIFDTIKHHVGGVSDALNGASERLASAKNKAEQDKIKRETYELILKEVQRENDKLLKGAKRSDSRQRANSNHFGRSTIKAKRVDDACCGNCANGLPCADKDQILTYITDNSGNMMGICQLRGVKYRFLKPVYGDTVLTPVSETNLAYLFDLAPDLTLPQGNQSDIRSLVAFDSLKKKTAS